MSQHSQEQNSTQDYSQSQSQNEIQPSQYSSVHTSECPSLPDNYLWESQLTSSYPGSPPDDTENLEALAREYEEMQSRFQNDHYAPSQNDSVYSSSYTETENESESSAEKSSSEYSENSQYYSQ